jgi:o-succinylbenzoate synthase
MIRANVRPYQLEFKNPVLTSRGPMLFKNGYFIILKKENKIGIGECSFIEGLSRDKLDKLDTALKYTCLNINKWASLKDELLIDFPSLVFGFEMAFLSLKAKDICSLFDNDFSNQKSHIPINGLIWMGSEAFMRQQILDKKDKGFNCIKLKVGAIDFNEECKLLELIRNEYENVEIRLDANGAFDSKNVKSRIQTLSQFKIHSIEQPIKPNHHKLLQEICADNIIDIALDEELIYITENERKTALLEIVKPQFIIIKPSMLGGFEESEKWIEISNRLNIEWWATSALESNVGLNAIAQWVASKNINKTQGLGTGELYKNNITSPLTIENGSIFLDSNKKWDIDVLLN